MTEDASPALTVKRSFRDLSDEEVAEIEDHPALARAGWRTTCGWDELLQSRRVLIVSEAGAGKTYECQAQQAKLWKAGEPAFFLDLATLAGSSVREMLSQAEEERLDAWSRSQSETATFFLDSIDELKLTLGKFDQALVRLGKSIAGQLSRARIIITTRPVSVDRELILRLLPVPASAEAAPTAEAFADIVMDRRKKPANDDGKPKVWRNVGLMPLSLQEIREFSLLQGVVDPDALVADIRLRDAEDFAQRPQDLIELCSDWREHHRIRTHHEQVQTNIATKLKPSTERQEQAELSQVKAVEGASRVALAAMLTRKLTLRHSAESDSVHTAEAALDVSKILPDWSGPERATLLERPLFGFASYGRVRFHHRSVIEFLAAKRVSALLAQGTPTKAIKRLLFAETAQGTRTTRPSMRPVAAWIALSKDTVFDDIVAIDPAVVLNYGDPQSLRPAQRIRALEAYVDRHGVGGWRGLSTPSVQVHRFSSSELSDTVSRKWAAGIENPEIRILLLQMIGSGRLDGCADVAYSVAMDGSQSILERDFAIAALMQLKDARLEGLADSLENDALRWPDAMARRAVIQLFPAHLPAPRLAQILLRVKENPRSIGDLNFQLPREIETADLSPEYLDDLRQGLTDIVIDGVTWERDKFPHLRTKRPDLRAALVAACYRQSIQGVRTEPWITSSLLAIRLSKEDFEKEAITELRRSLANLSSQLREAAFWKEDAFLASLHEAKDTWHRVFDLSRYGGIELRSEADSQWVRKRLSDPHESLVHREMMLWVEMLLLNQAVSDHRSLLEALKGHVADEPTLVAIAE
jgi:NACHT domain.